MIIIIVIIIMMIIVQAGFTGILLQKLKIENQPPKEPIYFFKRCILKYDITKYV